MDCNYRFGCDEYLELEAEVARLQARIDALEAENERLRHALDAAKAVIITSDQVAD